jgi:quinol monooxygenase YgiN
MAVGLLFDGIGVSQDQYEQVFNQVTNHGAEPPTGSLSHHAGPTEGGFCVIETWESPEALQTFYETKLGAALEAAGIQVQPRIFQIVNSLP